MPHKPRMKRWIALATFLLAAGCGNPDEDPQAAYGGGEGEPGGGDRRIECAVEGAAEFERVCTLERVSEPQGTGLILRGPGGGFRRFLITADGRGLVAADGAVPAVVTPISDDLIEVAVGDDRYRLPATVRAGARPGR